MAMEPRRRLGRGLDALLGAYPSEPELRVAAEWRAPHAADRR